MFKALLICGFSCLYLIGLVLYLSATIVTDREGLLILAIIFSAVCVVTFLFAGSKLILFSSILSYGHILFISTPAVLMGVGAYNIRPQLDVDSVVQFMTIFFLLQLAVLAFSRLEPSPPRWSIAVGSQYQVLALLIAGIVLAISIILPNPQLGIISAPFWLVAIVLSSLVAFSSRTLGTLFIHSGFLTLIVLTYYFFGFGGFGRLILASYLLSIAIVFSWLMNSYLPKLLIIFLTFPSLIVLSWNRVSFIRAEYGTTIDSDESMESVFGPFQSGVHLFSSYRDGMLSPTWGESIFISFLFWIPRSLWSSKPDGFGRAIVAVTQPDLVSLSIFSDAAPYVSESIWDFGFVGPIMTLILVISLTRFDSRIAKWLRGLSGKVITASAVFSLAAAACGVSMLLNYVWGGFFTFNTRTLIPVLVLLVAAILTKRRAPRARPATEDARRQTHGAGTLGDGAGRKLSHSSSSGSIDLVPEAGRVVTGIDAQKLGEQGRAP